MNILVNATALNERGAYSVIQGFLFEISNNVKYLKKKGIILHVLVSKSELCKFNRENLVVDYTPFPKKNLYNKFIYENYYLPKLIKTGNFNAYISLQNYGMKKRIIPQYCLMHQAIPFSNLGIKDLEIKNYLKYKILLPYIYKKSIKKLNGIFVQTSWLKVAIENKFNYKDNIFVIKPKVNNICENTKPLPDRIIQDLNNNDIKLIYVTSDEKYKNNDRLIEAIKRYNQRNDNCIKLYITLKGKSCEHIKYIDKIPFESIFTLYKSVDALIFPSLAETLGLPLLEAQEAGIDILSCNEPFAKEVCGSSGIYFDAKSIESIILSLENYVNKKLNNLIMKYELTESIKKNNEGYIEFIKIVYENNKKDIKGN
jgi:hypothetical protein